MRKHNDVRRAAAALYGTLGLAAAPHAVSAQEASPFDARQSEAIERLVQQYLLEHPEVLVEALRRYEQQQQAAEARRQAEAIAALAGQPTAHPRDPVIGHPQGVATLVEFFDYRLGYSTLMTGTPAKPIGEDPPTTVGKEEHTLNERQGDRKRR